MSKLEIFLICLSLIETLISARLYKRMIRAEKLAKAKEAEYREAAFALGIWSNSL